MKERIENVQRQKHLPQKGHNPASICDMSDTALCASAILSQRTKKLKCMEQGHERNKGSRKVQLSKRRRRSRKGYDFASICDMSDTALCASAILSQYMEKYKKM